jgi:hypothetical protein
MHNASLWLDALVVPSGVSPDPRDPSFNRQRTVHTRKSQSCTCRMIEARAHSQHIVLTRYFPKAKVRKAKSLVGSKADNEKDEEPEVGFHLCEQRKLSSLPKEQDVIVSHWHKARRVWAGHRSETDTTIESDTRPRLGRGPHSSGPRPSSCASVFVAALLPFPSIQLTAMQISKWCTTCGMPQELSAVRIPGRTFMNC